MVMNNFEIKNELSIRQCSDIFLNVNDNNQSNYLLYLIC